MRAPCWRPVSQNRSTSTSMPTSRWTGSKRDLRRNSRSCATGLPEWTAFMTVCTCTTLKRTPCSMSFRVWFLPGPGNPSLTRTLSASFGSMSCWTIRLVSGIGPISTLASRPSGNGQHLDEAVRVTDAAVNSGRRLDTLVRWISLFVCSPAAIAAGVTRAIRVPLRKVRARLDTCRGASTTRFPCRPPR